MTLLTHLAWLAVASTLLGWAVVVLFPTVIDHAVEACERAGDLLDRWCERWLERRHRTAVDRLARHTRRQETGR